MSSRSPAHLEHVNITVSDPDRSAAFFERLCGWKERWRGPAIDHGRTIHVGNETEYLALYAPDHPVGTPFAKGVPLMHVGLEVEDLEAAEAIVKDAGFETFGHADYPPGRRFYFFDWDGIEFEVLSYA